jgi:prevent-host-death family protein
MCYMSNDRPARVGVRELRQNLSIYLDRVKAGETLEVTERGVPVAVLRPRLPAPVSILDRMIVDGRARPATVDHRLVEPAPPGAPGQTLTEILLEMREEDRR